MNASNGEYLTIREAAARLKIHPVTVRKKIDSGVIPAIQIGGPGSALRIDASELAVCLRRAAKA